MDARTWMERYVRTSLKRKGDASGSNNTSNAISALSGGDAPQSSRKTRSDSLIRGGTGRYAEELGDCIATEKGLLKREDF